LPVRGTPTRQRSAGPQPHKSQKLIYKIYIFAQLSKLELVQIFCFV
jgi:hypothetical protein